MSAPSLPRWERRFRAPAMGFPHWARDEPDRLAVATNETGAWQVYAWDRTGGTRRRVTDHPIGVMGGSVTPEGADVVWFHDETGDEVGHWVAERFEGGERRKLIDGVPDAWTTGLAIGSTVKACGTADDEGFTVWVDAGDGPRPLHRHSDLVELGGLSRDGTLLCLQHAEHGDTIHLALRVVDLRTDDAVGDQWDGPGLGLQAAGWSPVAGDQRLAFVHEREGVDRPGVWDAATGTRRDAQLDLPGDVDVVGWWPDGSALLLSHAHQGRDELWHLALADDRLTRVDHPPGTISGARVRPDGDVWYRISNGASPPSIRNSAGDELVAPEGDRPPDGRPYRSWSFSNPKGDTIHGFVAAPEGEGPHPAVMLVHGGPTWAYTDTFMPETQAWVDHGFAVAMVNYRGSTGYGVGFRDALIGNPGFPEVEDVVAGLDSLVAEGTVDARRVVVAGGSWGGYITLLAVGIHPDRWAAGLAAVPVADYVTAYADEAPTLQAFDRSLFGGSPDDVGDLYVERSPLTYADDVQAPLLIIAGDHDSRCPIQQVLNYVERLRQRGRAVELYRFDAGHGSLVIDERVRQMRAQLEFVSNRVPGGKLTP